MCIIIDANKAADFCKQEHPYLKVLMKWVSTGGRIASGGELEKELFKVAEMRGLFIEWTRTGVLKRVSGEKIAETIAKLHGRCRSNDAHVIALAIEAKANIIVTGDRELIADLKDRSLVGVKRRIYKENSANPNNVDRHKVLLRQSDCP